MYLCLFTIDISAINPIVKWDKHVHQLRDSELGHHPAVESTLYIYIYSNPHKDWVNSASTSSDRQPTCNCILNISYWAGYPIPTRFLWYLWCSIDFLVGHSCHESCTSPNVGRSHMTWLQSSKVQSHPPPAETRIGRPPKSRVEVSWGCETTAIFSYGKPPHKLGYNWYNPTS